MRLQLFVCPACGLAALRNPDSRGMGSEGNRIVGGTCVADRSGLSYVHDVELTPANSQNPSKGAQE